MSRITFAALVLCCLIACLASASATPGAVALPRVTLQTSRESDKDLEIGGDLNGLPPGSTRFVSYRDLLTLPQVSYTVTDDTNFSGATRITGIALTALAKALGAAQQQLLVVAICYDGYRTNYPAAYLAAHDPILVLKINGKTQEGWPKAKYGSTLGPYLVSHPSFKPSFQVLSHSDEPQIPFGVTRIEFRDERAVLGSIAPPGHYPPDSMVADGYRIAQQNCFRCHNSGAEGGRMSGRDWQTLAMWASSEPQYFDRYVKNPKAIDPKNHMPGFPQYDAQTIEALRQYFATFAEFGSARGKQ